MHLVVAINKDVKKGLPTVRKIVDIFSLMGTSTSSISRSVIYLCCVNGISYHYYIQRKHLSEVIIKINNRTTI